MQSVSSHSPQLQTGAHYTNDFCEREPPPYPGYNRPLFQPGLRQSYSGSEVSTDYSLSSCENLCSSVRQEPQGEETSSVQCGPLDPTSVQCGPLDPTSDVNLIPIQCGPLNPASDKLVPISKLPESGGSAAIYREALTRLGLSQGQVQGPPNMELKSTNSGSFYVPGNQDSSSPPKTTTTVCSGSHDNNMVNISSHGNHFGSLDNYESKQLNGNNNNNGTGYPDLNIVQGLAVTQGLAMTQVQSQPQLTLSQYQQETSSLCEQVSNNNSQKPSYPTSPTPSPTPSLTPGKSSSPRKGPSPIPTPNPQHQYYTAGVSRPKSVPHMGCGAISMPHSLQGIETEHINLPKSPTVAAPGPIAMPSNHGNHAIPTTFSALNTMNSGMCISENKNHIAAALPQISQMLTLAGQNKNITSQHLDETLADSGQPLAQLMMSIARQSMQNNAGSSSLSSLPSRQRPSTAPATRHLPTTAPPDYPGYTSIAESNSQSPTTPDQHKDKPALTLSQPDLTQLSDLDLRPQLQQMMPHSEPNIQVMPVMQQKDIQDTNNLNNLATVDNLNHSSDAAGTRAAPQTLSTSSSTSSLIQYQQQHQQHYGQGLPSYHELQGIPSSNNHTTTSSPIPYADLSLMAQVQQLYTTNNSLMGADKQTSGSQSPSLRRLPELGHAAVATRATKMVERLSEENRFLRQELEGYATKVYRLQKLESEIQKVQENYKMLEKHSHKQESLEKLFRFKLEAEIKKLQDTNKELKENLDKTLRHLQQNEVYSAVDSEIRKELLGKDSLIAKLLSQNRDLTTTKDRLELDVTTHKATVSEQSAHLSLLDSALSTARSNVLKYEEEINKRNSEDEKISELQKALSQLQLAVEKRESIEQQLRHKLEEEVQYLRNQQNVNKMSDADEGISSDSESPTSLQSLVRQMQEKEQRITALEAEVTKVMLILVYLWKQKYLEETALRQFAVDAASVPKDARIAALEQNSLESEKIIAEARTERLQHLDEVHGANRKCAELEAKMKTLQAQLAEKDAMIKVLHRHTPHSHTSSISSLLGSPIHSPRPSFAGTPSPLSSPCNSPLSSLTSSATPSGASSRQNSQLDSSVNYSSGSVSNDCNGNSGKEWEGKTPIHSKSNSLGTSTTVCNNNGSLKDSQLRENAQRITAQAALFGGFQSGSDQLKKYLWQV